MFPVKKMEFKILIFILSQISKNQFYHFYLASAISMVQSDLFIFDNAIRITLQVPSIGILLSIHVGS